jgi:HK97 family phage major capsid protein
MPDIVPEITDEERKKREQSTVMALVTNIVRSERESWTAEMASALNEWKAPDRSKVPEQYKNPAEHRGTLTLSSPMQAIYRRMPEEVRAIRNEDSDHWMAEEFRAIAYNDRGRLFNAHAKLAGLFERATTTEGISAASGAYSTGTGGTLISRPVEQLVLIAKERVSKMPIFASSLTMTKQTHTIPTGAAMTAYQTLEGGTTTQGEPTYAAVQLTAVKGAARGIVTLEMLEDADANVVSFMTTRAGTALGGLQEAQFWRTGDGTDPNISAFAAGTAYTETTSAALDYTSVIGMYYTLAQVYRTNAAWYSNATVLQLMAKVRDGQGRAFYQGITERPLAITDDPNACGAILGKPVYEVDATAGTIHFGDMSALYMVGTRAGITARMSEHVGFATGTVQFIWEQRYDGNNIDTSACLSCTGITSANSL